MQRLIDPAAAVAARILQRAAVVLLVDPWWPDFGDSLKPLVALRAERITVYPTGSGVEAVQVARHTRFAVAAISMSTGVRGGLHAVQVASQLQRVERPPRLLFTSASTKDGDAPQVNLVKIPVVGTNELAAAVRAVLDGRDVPTA